MSNTVIRIATRKSPLALWQAHFIKDQLLKLWPHLCVELYPMITTGDRFLKDKLLTQGGKGLFVKELEQALLEKKADIAVHSMKDVPAALPNGLILPIICKRANPKDAFVSMHYSTLHDLPKGAKIGTASLRRQSQILALRPDLKVHTLRGNIHTRLDKLRQGEYDAILLAAAGLERMGLEQLISEQLCTDIFLPACGQGALGIECRQDDESIMALIAPLHHEDSAQAVSTEREVNRLLGGNCHVPLAVFCEQSSKTEILLRAKIMKIDGSQHIDSQRRGPANQALILAKHCAQDLLDQGGAELLAETLPI